MNLEGYGLNIIRFTNKEIDDDFDQVCKKILVYCDPPFGKGGREGGIVDT